MIGHTLQREIFESLEPLDPAQQRRVLEFAKSLKQSTVQGTPGKDLLRFAGTLDDGDADEMLRAIQDGCEKVDPHGW